MRRRGFSEEMIRQVEDIYRIIYVRGYNISKALDIVESEIADSAEKARILDFIRSSTYGVIKGMIE